MSKKYFGLVALVLLLSLTLFGCGGQQAEEQPGGNEGQAEEINYDGEIKIGLMIPLTGSEATYGKDMENAMKMAADEINAEGGILGKKLVTISGDTAADPQQSTSAATKLVSSDVVSVVGGYSSGATLPTLNVFADANIPQVIPVANSTKIIDENPGNAVQINGTGFHQAEKALELFEDIWDVEKLAIVHQGDGYSEDLAKLTREAWEEAGHEVVAFEVINKGEQDFSSLVTSIKSKNPDAVYWTAYYADGALLIKQLRQGGFQGEIAVGDGSNSPKLMEIAGNAAEGVVCTSNPMVEYLPAAKEFMENYKTNYNQDPGPYSSLAYDGMHLMKDAIERAGSTDGDAIIKALKETEGFQGISGKTTIADNNALANSNFVLLEATGGQWQLIE